MFSLVFAGFRKGLSAENLLFRQEGMTDSSRVNRPFSYPKKEPGSSVIFIHFDTRCSIEWRWSFYHYCAHSKILQNLARYRSIQILSQNS